MKKLSNYICVLFCLLAVGLIYGFSQTEIVIDGANRVQNVYQGSSFKYVSEVILRPGFSVSAASNGNWYARPVTYIPNNSPQDLNKNFVRTETILKEGVTSENTVSSLSIYNKSSLYEYVDDLGRPIQKVNVRSSSGLNDGIQFFEYDKWGRQLREHLSYSFGEFEKWGSYRENALSEQVGFYTNTSGVKADQEPFKFNSFDDSPLNQVKQAYGPGILWHKTEGNRFVKTTVTANTSIEEIIHFNYVGTTRYPQIGGLWPANTLLVSEMIDEENHIKRSYKDFRGQLVLDRTGDGTVWHDTYYLYDISGNITLVFPPEAIAKLVSDYEPVAADKQAFLNRWVFQYEYDEFGRKTGSKVPGGGWSYFIYDSWDRLVLTQDANQRNSNQWTFTKYDIFNRPILTGFVSGERAVLVTSAANNSVRYEMRLNNSVGYSNLAFPAHNDTDLLTITYYDDYAFIGYINWDAETHGSNYNFIPETGFHQSSDAFHSVKGNATGSKIKILNQEGKWLNSVTYYDNRYRVIQTLAENFLGGIDRVTNKYDFSGKTLKTQQIHNNGSTVLTLLNEFEYDHAGRVLQVYQTLDNTPRILVSSNTYNELGELIEKNLHSTDEGATFLQSVDYRYNIRGWLTHINNSMLTNDGINNNDANDLFGMDIVYNQETIDVSGNLKTLYNGNISAIRWNWNNLKDPQQEKIFKYSYDTWSRLGESHFATKNGTFWNGTSGGYNESMSYDKNGNILSLNRTGKLGAANPTLDNLAYKYVGNQLTNVHDNSAYWNANDKNPDYGFSEIFHNENLTEYEYDNNGNLEGDLNKGIVSIDYNHLNMPERIELENDLAIEYTYDAIGNKLRKVAKVGSEEVSRTDYIGSIHYVDNKLTFLLTDEGRAVKRNGGFDYEYFLKDHQGNTRVVFGSMNQTDVFEATLETERNAKETEDFINVTRATGYNHTSKNYEMLDPKYAAVLNGGVGPAKMISVRQGDKLNLETYARYTGAVSSTKVSATALSAAVTGAFQITPVGETQTAYNAVNGGVLGSPAGENSGAPKAYLYYFLFSADYTWHQFGFHTMSTTASAQFEQMNLNFTVNFPTGVTEGFVYTYVANETVGTPVHFDDFKIIHEKGTKALQVIQASDYYPFGLTINPLSYQKEMLHNARTENKYTFQNQELQSEFDLDWYQYKYRMHDPAIGRFGGIDPLSEKYYYNSTYAFSENRLIEGVELEGLEVFEMMKYYSPVAVRLNFSEGSHSEGIGWEVSIGAPKYWPFSYRKSWAGTYYTYNPIQGKSFSETRTSIETSYFGMISMQSNSYSSPDMSQSTGMVTIGSSFFNLKYENDWQPKGAMKVLDPFKLHPVNGGDGGDRWRTAAFQANIGFFNTGFNLATGDPGLSSGDRDRVYINKQAFYVPNKLGDNPDNYRLGIGYFGWGPLKIGTNSEWNRNLIQNQITHTLTSSPYFKVIESNPQLFFQYSSPTGSLWGW